MDPAESSAVTVASPAGTVGFGGERPSRGVMVVSNCCLLASRVDKRLTISAIGVVVSVTGRFDSQSRWPVR